ncbi:Acyl-CoA N-acyltransferase [Penicillium sp. IBT 18751x]|nr:Acyl-CoA N-acyltransferase [Penicillium sp. IBT 18751x]
MASALTLTTAILPPPGPELSLPDQPNSNPAVFQDAMTVRMRVFVDEQHFSADAEIDEDDARSWHWVISANTTPGTSIPVAVIRLVPPPQKPHELLTHPETILEASYDWTHEPYIKLSRVAVLREYRGLGLGRKLIQVALEWAAHHAAEIDNAAAQVAARSHWTGKPARWQGLVVIHSQADVEGMYRRSGFQTDETLERWDEEGVEHVGMFRRVEVAR